MEQRRYITFIILAMVVLGFNFFIMPKFLPKPKPKQDQKAGQADKLAKGEKGKEDEKKLDKGKDEEPAKKEPPQIAAPTEKVASEWATLGSGDPASDYRMLVTFTNAGAAVERIELNSPRYHDVEQWEDTSGYLGHLAETDAPKEAGCLVRVVGPGTPAGNAGLKAGDVITSFAGAPVKHAGDFYLALKTTAVGQKVEIIVDRDGKQETLTAVLAPKPLSVVKPEEHLDGTTDPLSFLITLAELDDAKLGTDDVELPGLKMRTANWKLSRKDDEVAFTWSLPDEKLEIVKRFRLAKVPAAESQDSAFPGYHLEMTVEIRNDDDQPHRVAYRLDGPTGLPTEGSWYAYKISPVWWDSAGLRDVAIGRNDGGFHRQDFASCRTIIDDKLVMWEGLPLKYIGVDAQYFASMILPELSDPTENPFVSEQAMAVGPIPEKANDKKLTDVSCRITSKSVKIEPGKTGIEQKFQLFAGPKKPDLLANYGLDDLVYYGLFGFVAKPMLAVLHAVYKIIPNYGIAIILLTVLVRSAMFPISRKQALNAQKMQELQPELKRIAELYKGNMEQRGKAQQELFRKHKYNPLAGCLPALLQLPIFMGLYRSLSCDVELRQAPLISESIRWCSNLSAPDMLWYWQNYLPGFLASPDGWLGPYLNVLPLVTIGLFLWQQKMFMPPPTDEQSAMQQKMMQYMMIFVSFMFFKVASGLCIYFIASSIWGIAERKLLPKTVPAGGDTIDVRSRPASSGANGSTKRNKKQRGKK